MVRLSRECVTRAASPIHEVRDALGHSSTTMTSAYLRTGVNSLKQAYQKRERLRIPTGQSRRSRRRDT